MQNTNARQQLSVFDLFKIGIGPSSSHTVGPMRAAGLFLKELTALNQDFDNIDIHLFGSLAATGIGHGTNKAVVLGLMGEKPESVDPNAVAAKVQALVDSQKMLLPQLGNINFSYKKNIIFHATTFLPKHPNALTFKVFNQGTLIYEKNYYSVGGGFVETDEDPVPSNKSKIVVPYPFNNANTLLAICKKQNLSISALMYANEDAVRCREDTDKGILLLWEVMESSIHKGLNTEGKLPGGLGALRRAPSIAKKMAAEKSENWIFWSNVWAMAVSEENAAGGRMVTAPTNGAAGIIPSILYYALKTINQPAQKTITSFMLTATAIGTLYKINASISGADVGCQGEVGSACSMAAAGLAECLGGTPYQIENAAEIAMEHHLGLTCDPIGGLVQIPCIERNAMASVKAINAVNIALNSDGSHIVSLDQVITTMRDTGRDMSVKYKETSSGGLAVNVPYC